jgi:Flavin containing amine oxidoreductase
VSVASNPDILIIGAGLAGAAATEALAARGFTLTVLEARDRIGGRGFSRRFANSDELLEFGGTWIRPWQTQIHDACARHGVALRRRAPITERRWFHDGALHQDAPASPDDLPQHERCVSRITADAVLLKRGVEHNELGQSLTDISFADYLTRIGAPQATRDLCSAWWTVSGNGDPARIPAAELLSSCARGSGAPDSLMDVSADTLVGGVTLLAERMIVVSGASVVRSAAITGSRMVPTASQLRLRTDALGMRRRPCSRPGSIRSERSRLVRHCPRRKPLRWPQVTLAQALRSGHQRRAFRSVCLRRAAAMALNGCSQTA